MKYEEANIGKLHTFIDDMTSDSSGFWRQCSVHHIACLLDVSRETIYAWKKKYPEFSDTIKRWEEKRNALFLELRNKNGAWIFLAKNWLGMTDKQEITGDEQKPLKVIIEEIVTDTRPDEG